MGITKGAEMHINRHSFNGINYVLESDFLALVAVKAHTITCSVCSGWYVAGQAGECPWCIIAKLIDEIAETRKDIESLRIINTSSHHKHISTLEARTKVCATPDCTGGISGILSNGYCSLCDAARKTGWRPNLYQTNPDAVVCEGVVDRVVLPDNLGVLRVEVPAALIGKRVRVIIVPEEGKDDVTRRN